MEIVTGWDIYWVMQMDTIKGMVVVFIGLTLLALFIGGMVGGMEGYFEKIKLYRRVYISVLGLLFFLVAIGGVIPSTKTMAALYILPPIINNENIQQIPDELFETLGLTNDLIKKKIKEELEE